MQVSRKTHRILRLQNMLFIALFLSVIGLLGWLGTRYHYQADWTANARNTLSEASRALLRQIDGPIAITAYAREDQALRKQISGLVGRYQRDKRDVSLEFVNPDTAPDRVRELNISVDGELIVRYRDKQENLKELTEPALTNTLQRLARSKERWLVFLEGHGERSPLGQANHDLSDWVRQLKNKGINVQPVNLSQQTQVPDNANALVIASPQVDLLHGEVKLIQDFVARGGNLLWLIDPGALHGLSPLAEQLGVRLKNGMVVDPNTQLLGIGDPRFAIVGEYPPHPITQNFQTITLFPLAGALELGATAGWQEQVFLHTSERSWLETSPISDRVGFDKGQDTAGPINLGVALTRPRPGGSQEDKAAPAAQQRIAVIADGDFLSNAYVGNGGNIDLGLNLVNWLSHDDRFIDIPVKAAIDSGLELSAWKQGVIGFGFFLVVPGALLLAGLLIWLRRRKR